MIKKDIFTKEKRSEIMSSIKSKNTKIERRLAEELERRGLKFEKHVKLPGTPDFVFSDKRLVVFCHGDFWHGLNYKFMKPKLNDYWRNKIEKNMKRDAKVAAKLLRKGWRVVTLKGSKISKNVSRCADILERRLVNYKIWNKYQRAWKWFCLRYHRQMSSAKIARKYGVTRQAVNRATIVLAYRLLSLQNKNIHCRICNRILRLTPSEIKTDKYDNWKKYTQKEIEHIKGHIKKKAPEQIAKDLKRTTTGVVAKIRRLNLE